MTRRDRVPLQMGAIRPSYGRVVDVMEALYEMTLPTRGRSDHLTDRYSERDDRARKAIDRRIDTL